MIKKSHLTILVLALSVTTVFGQNFSMKYGVITKNEIDLIEYAEDKDAEAVVLFDVAKSYFVENNNSFEVKFERTTRIKILSEAGIKYAEVEIPFYHENDQYEKIYELEAMSYNFENGKLAKSAFDASNTFDEKINDQWSIRKFAIPNVKVGSIIEYRYSIRSPQIFNFRDWEFQWRIPVVYSEYIAKMIPFYEYTYILQGASKFDVFESYEDTGFTRTFGGGGKFGLNSYHDMVYKFAMKNVPAFGDEEFITSINDYIIKLDFQLSVIHRLNGSVENIITTWEELIKELNKANEFGKYINKSVKISSDLLDFNEISSKPEPDKFNTVLDYVKGNYNWNGYRRKFASKNPNQLVKDKTGNTADLNLFTVGLLNSVGIESYPVIMSTRQHGKISVDYPFSHFFNYVIILAKVDGKDILADATEILSKNDRIPTRCINDKGLVVKEDEVNWIDLECLFSSEITTDIEMAFEENNAKVDVKKTGTEYDALYFRNKFGNKIDNIIQSVSSAEYSLKENTVQIQNYADKTMPYTFGYSMDFKPEVVNDKIYIAPFLDEALSENPLKQKSRIYPIDMVYPQKRSFKSTIPIPEGYQVDFTPNDLVINTDLFGLNYSVIPLDNKLQILFSYHFKKSIYYSNEYAKIKQYFSVLINKGNEKIVFSKKE